MWHVTVPDAAPETCGSCYQLSLNSSSRTVILHFKVTTSVCCVWSSIDLNKNGHQYSAYLFQGPAVPIIHSTPIIIPQNVTVTWDMTCLQPNHNPNPVVKVVMWSWGLTWRSQVGANPIPIPHPTNLSLFGHKITLYRFNQGAHTIAGGSNWSPLAPFTLTTALILL